MNGYSSKELADFRQIIWKSLLEKSRNVVQALRTFDLEPANHANKVRCLLRTFCPSESVLSRQANCECIMNHRTDIDDPEFSFLPEFIHAVQELWADEIISVLLERSSELSMDNDAA